MAFIPFFSYFAKHRHNSTFGHFGFLQQRELRQVLDRLASRSCDASSPCFLLSAAAGAVFYLDFLGEDALHICMFALG